MKENYSIAIASGAAHRLTLTATRGRKPRLSGPRAALAEVARVLQKEFAITVAVVGGKNAYIQISTKWQQRHIKAVLLSMAE